jgi:hypothetical protein
MAETSFDNAFVEDEEPAQKADNNPAAETSFDNAPGMGNNGEDSDEEEGEGTQADTAEAPVHIMDPDFLCFALPFAGIVDLLDIFLEVTGIFVIPKLLGMMIDGVVFVTLGGWMYWRTNELAQTRKKQKEQMQKQLSQKSAKMEQQLAKGAKGPLKKVFMRMGVVLIGELIPFLGLVPFWTISVISTLFAEKEK